ncbi:hypothetical protein QFC24_005447 [Naganishia onofrii]|uniref:Uncharacterized protein n=1 Tax=Naganishia onofrii TaxID=1851511 RepID=A0ACC2X7E3_9TREE|nr:hypothetical protein QFC24_005447 [Naganishia onofrii]
MTPSKGTTADTTSRYTLRSHTRTLSARKNPNDDDGPASLQGYTRDEEDTQTGQSSDTSRQIVRASSSSNKPSRSQVRLNGDDWEEAAALSGDTEYVKEWTKVCKVQKARLERYKALLAHIRKNKPELEVKLVKWLEKQHVTQDLKNMLWDLTFLDLQEKFLVWVDDPDCPMWYMEDQKNVRVSDARA